MKWKIKFDARRRDVDYHVRFCRDSKSSFPIYKVCSAVMSQENETCLESSIFVVVGVEVAESLGVYLKI